MLTFQWHFYVKRRNKPEEWKCQPTKWLSAEQERHEILYGSMSLITVNTVTSLFATYIKNGGWSTVYYRFDEYSWTWYFLQWPVIFIYQVST
jgi:lathosterol oxidase